MEELKWDSIQMDLSAAAVEDVILAHLKKCHVYNIVVHPNHIFSAMRLVDNWNSGNSYRPLSVQYNLTHDHNLPSTNGWKVDDGETSVYVEGI